MTLFIVICALLTAAGRHRARLAAAATHGIGRCDAASGPVSPRPSSPPACRCSLSPATSGPATGPGTRPRQAAHPSSAPDLEHMVTQLQQRLSQQPDDVEGWKLLGRSATVLGQLRAARDAFAQAYTRSAGPGSGCASSATRNRSSSMTNARSTGRPPELFEKALAMAPDNRTRALVWRHRRLSAGRTGARATALGRTAESRPAAGAEADGRRAPVRARTQARRTRKTAGGRPRPASQRAFRCRSRLRVAGKVPPGATLFLIARRGEGGPPLAVVRRPVGAWPVTAISRSTRCDVARHFAGRWRPVRA